MNQESMNRLFSAWRWVRDAEHAIADHLYGEFDGEALDLGDALGELVDAKDALGDLIAEYIGETADEIESKVMQAERARFGLPSKDGE